MLRCPSLPSWPDAQTLPYPMPFYTRGLDGRIDNARAGWKGRGIRATYSSYMPKFSETRLGSVERLSVGQRGMLKERAARPGNVSLAIATIGAYECHIRAQPAVAPGFPMFRRNT